MKLTFSLKFTLSATLAVVLTAAIIGYSLTSLNLTALKNVSRELYISVAENVGDELAHKVATTRLLMERAAAALDNPLLADDVALQMIGDALAATNAAQTLGFYDTNGKLVDALTKGRAVELPSQLAPNVLAEIRTAFFASASSSNASSDASLSSTSFSNSFPSASNAASADGMGVALRLQTLLPSTNAAAPVIPVVTQWRSGGRLLGYLLATVDNETLCRVVAVASGRAFGGSQNQVYVVDDSLRVAAHFEQNRVRAAESLAGKELFAESSVQPGKLPQNAVGMAVEYSRTNGEAMVGTLAIVPAFRCSIVVEQTQNIAYKAIHTMRLRVLMWGSIGVVVGVLLSVLVARQFSRPVEQLSVASGKMAEQDFSVRLPEGRSDELGALFRIHNRVAEELARYQKLNVNRIISERNKLEAVMRQASDGVLIVDALQTVMVVNPVFSEWFLTRAEDAEGKNVADAFSTIELTAKLASAMASSDNEHSAAMPLEIQLLRAGEVRETILRGSVVKVVVDGSVAALAAILRDVTKEVEIDRMKTELVSVVAHELRSPLTSIVGMSELIAEGELQHEDTTDFAQRIASQAKRLNAIITKFLDLNRIESGKTELRSFPFKMDDVLHSVLKVNMRLAEKKGITIRTVIPSKVHAVTGDPDLIGQAMLNLFSNAVKYSPAGTTATVSLVEKAESVLLSVQDNGYGISESSKAKLFTKFFRATDDDRVSAETGTGLGLAFVKEIVERHGGAVGVESRLHEGSTFWFTLPKEG